MTKGMTAAAVLAMAAAGMPAQAAAAECGTVSVRPRLVCDGGSCIRMSARRLCEDLVRPAPARWVAKAAYRPAPSAQERARQDLNRLIDKIL